MTTNELIRFAWQKDVKPTEIARDLNESKGTVLKWLNDDLTEQKESKLLRAIGNVHKVHLAQESDNLKRSFIKTENAPKAVGDLLGMTVSELLDIVAARRQ